MKFVKRGCHYESDCGRFSILNNSVTSRSNWVLFDRDRQDALLPQYSWSRHCSTLASAKRFAERISRLPS